MQTKIEQQQQEELQALKTGGLVVTATIATLALSPTDNKLGLLAGTLALLGYFFHEKGKNLRPVENATHNATSFFAPVLPNASPKSDAMENAVQNIVVGGAKTCDELYSMAGGLVKK